MAIFKCKMCGGTLDINPGDSIAVCDYCGTKQTLPKLDDDKRANMYDRANHFRRNNEYDKAMGIYEQILNEDNTDAEAYWSIVLCRYGIEYVEDPATHTRIPTVNRAQYTSVFDDDNYKSALQYASAAQHDIYVQEATAINEIQKGILAISQKEEPFDVFICYKETDKDGRRTPDSVLANDLYHQLTNEGFKVFFSRITLEDKLGTAYEPYIFAALNSAKVMVVLGTKPEYFNAVWVKNEWSRYLSLIKNGANKILIPAYRDMDPYDLPEEFSHLQAQDMSKLGFMQDLIRGIKKLTEDTKQETIVKETKVISESASVAPLLKRTALFLEDGNWQEADQYCERVLDLDPENAQAYLYKLMAKLRVRTKEALRDCNEPFDNEDNYRKTLRFADKALAEELKGYVTYIKDRNEKERKESKYNYLLSEMERANSERSYKSIASEFATISGYKDSDTLKKQCEEKAEECRLSATYYKAVSFIIDDPESLRKAAEIFDSISSYKDSAQKAEKCRQRAEEVVAEKKRIEEERRIAAEKKKKKTIRIKIITSISIFVCIVIAVVVFFVIIPNIKYNKAMMEVENNNFDEAITIFTELGDFSDSAEKVLDLKYRKAEGLLFEKNYGQAVTLFGEIGEYKDAKEQHDKILSEMQNIARLNGASIAYGNAYHAAVKTDGTVVNASAYDNKVSEWRDIIAVSAGAEHLVGLKSNGKVVVDQRSYYSDFGTDYGQDQVYDWTDIVAVSAGSYFTVGLNSNGTVVAVGSNSSGQCDVSGWTDIVAISASGAHTVGLKSDGSVVAVGDNEYGQCNVSDWTDIVAVSAGNNHTVGLKADGTVVAVGYNDGGKCDVSEWKDIISISASLKRTVGLKADGTIIFTTRYGDTTYNSLLKWTDIVGITSGLDNILGLKRDGTVTVKGGYISEISGWTDIAVYTE